MNLAEACLANDFGAKLSQLGVEELRIENQQWGDGEDYVIPT